MIHLNTHQESAAPRWPTQLFVLHGEDRAELLGRLQWLRQRLDEHPQEPLEALSQLLVDCVYDGGERLALIAADHDALRQRVDRALQRLSDPNCGQIRDVSGVYYTSNPLYQDGAKVAFLYPGEGAQYLGMLGDMMALPEVRTVFEHASQYIVATGAAASPPLDFVHLPEDLDKREELEARLKRLDNAMLTVLVADWAMTLVLENMGAPCAAMGGHSAGELAALMMAEAMESEDTVGSLITSMSELESAPGVDATLLAIGASRDAVQSLLDELDEGDKGMSAELAMDNCPHQTVVVGLSNCMAAVEEAVQKKGMMYERLELARPYHTALFEPLMGPLRKMFGIVNFRAPATPVYSCTTGELFPLGAEAIRELCLSHWRCRVEFVKMIRRMHDDGVRLFIEAGPRGNLCSFVDDILRGEQYLAAPANVPRRHGLTQLQHLAGQLFVHGVPLNLRYFADAMTADPKTAMGRRQPKSLGRIDGDGPTEAAAANAAANAARGVAPPSPPSHAPLVGNSSGGAASVDGVVMQHYLQVMDEFLATQEEVMTRFLTGEGPVSSSDSCSASGLWPDTVRSLCSTMRRLPWTG